MAEYILHPSSELAWADLFNEWQRVAVDKAPVDHGLADLQRKIEVEQVVAVYLDIFPINMLVTNLDQTPPTLYSSEILPYNRDVTLVDVEADFFAEIDRMLDADSERLLGDTPDGI